eukprot:1160985-Pelagomonas_calceolata.AAC.9
MSAKDERRNAAAVLYGLLLLNKCEVVTRILTVDEGAPGICVSARGEGLPQGLHPPSSFFPGA